MEKRIRHEGVVESVGPHAVKVRIMQTSACAACQAASFCHASESKEKMIEVFTSSASSFEKGDSVVVWATVVVGFCHTVCIDGDCADCVDGDCWS